MPIAATKGHNMPENIMKEMPHTDKAKDKERVKYRRKKLFSYAVQAKKAYIPGLLFDALATASDLVSPLIVGYLLNQNNLLRAGTEDPSHYLGILIAFFVLTAASAVLRYVSALYLQKAANTIQKDMQNDVFAHLQTLPISYFDRLPAGKVVSRVTNDTKAVRNLFSAVLVRLLSAGIFGIGIYVSLFILDRRLFLLGLLPLPLMFFAFRDFQKKSSKWSYDVRLALSEVNGQLNENIQGMELIQSLNREDRIYQRFDEAINKEFDISLKMSKLWAYSTDNMTSAIRNFVIFTILAYFGFGNITQTFAVPLGNLYVFIDYLQRLFRQISQAMTRIGELERANGAADHIFELLKLEATTDKDGEMPPLKGDILFDHIDFSYVQDEPVLKDVTFEVPAGSKAAFVGHTGSGKSTIMNLLLGFYPPDSGTLWLDGNAMKELPILSVRRQMAIVLQDPYLFSGTIYDNIALGRNELSAEAAESALRAVGGSQLLDRLEEGIMSRVSERGRGFSVGERQLISFARALAQDPAILILDEATSNIDTETESLIQEAMKKVQEGRTTLIIAHRLSTVKDVDTIFVLDHGHLAEQGSHAELMEANGIYARMYREQSKSSR